MSENKVERGLDMPDLSITPFDDGEVDENPPTDVSPPPVSSASVNGKPNKEANKKNEPTIIAVIDLVDDSEDDTPSDDSPESTASSSSDETNIPDKKDVLTEHGQNAKVSTPFKVPEPFRPPKDFKPVENKAPSASGNPDANKPGAAKLEMDKPTTSRASQEEQPSKSPDAKKRKPAVPRQRQRIRLAPEFVPWYAANAQLTEDALRELPFHAQVYYRRRLEAALAERRANGEPIPHLATAPKKLPDQK